MPPGARCKALTDWLLSTDPHLRIRMAMAGFSSLMMTVSAIIVVSLTLVGYGRKDWVVWWGLFTGTGLVLVLVLIRSGWTRRLRDPALTQFQIRYALISNAAAHVILGQARGITPVILSMILMFGIFGMSTRQLAANMVFALVMFGAAIGIVAWLNEPGRMPGLEAANAVMILLVLLGSTFIAIRLQHIRERLTQQKLALTRAVEQIRHLATHDELTGLINRRRMVELMDVEWQRCARNTRPLILALFDLDHFKRINDTHGHAVGDQVLQAFADGVQATLRSTDVLARWGGEEFVLMLYDTDPACALPLLDRVRASVQAQKTPAAGYALRVTVSVGLAISHAGESVEQILERADKALYLAKAAGRNRVVQHGADPEPTGAASTCPSRQSEAIWHDI